MTWYGTHAPSLSQGQRMGWTSRFGAFPQEPASTGWLPTNQEGIAQGLCNIPPSTSAASSGNQGPTKCSGSQNLHLPPHTRQDKLRPAQTCRFPCGKHLSWKGRHFLSLFFLPWVTHIAIMAWCSFVLVSRVTKASALTSGHVWKV